jgi:aryl-alcohol dehydrogenase-like predicted oxidoreductase
MPSLSMCLEASLKKLRTSYIDILYVHWWDYGTSVQEVIDSLHTLIIQRKVPGYPRVGCFKRISTQKITVKHHFCIYQGNWSVLERSFQRDIIPMARSEGLALAPWGILGSGKIRTNAEEARRKESGEKGRTILNPNWERSPAEKKV